MSLASLQSQPGVAAQPPAFTNGIEFNNTMKLVQDAADTQEV